MEEKYNWQLILAASIPIAVIESYLFYTAIPNFLKLISLVTAVVLSSAIVYWKDKQKNNIFTAAGVVILIVIAASLIREFGFI